MEFESASKIGFEFKFEFESLLQLGLQFPFELEFEFKAEFALGPPLELEFERASSPIPPAAVLPNVQGTTATGEKTPAERNCNINLLRNLPPRGPKRVAKCPPLGILGQGAPGGGAADGETQAKVGL